MGLRNHEWKGYYPGRCNHLEELFIPALLESEQYDRITGDFSSSILSIFAEGLEQIVDRGGSIRIINGLTLTEADAEAVERGESDDVIKANFDWEDVRVGRRDDVLNALAWLIDEEIVEIKFGAVTDETKTPREASYGQWHQKVAIFTDENEDSISVVGSPNESFKALTKNRESIVLNRSWVENPTDDWDEARRLEAQKDEFDQLWQDREDGVAVFDLPEILERDLLDYRPEHEPDWSTIIQQIRTSESLDLPDPYPYQKRAIEALKSNNYRLLVNHATGTGKTWTALFTLRELADPNDVVVVLAPRKELVRQWASDDNIGRFFPKALKIQCSGNHDWRQPLLNALNTEHQHPIFVISTMHPSTMGDAFGLIEESAGDQRVSIIADEVHNLGSESRRATLEKFNAGKIRMGLSATPERGDAGDEVLMSFFGNKMDEITIEEAINDYNVLSQYRYEFHPVTLSPGERDDYIELSQEITEKYHQYRGSEDEPIIEVADRYGDLRTAITERADIIKECTEKTEVTEDLIDDVGRKTLVFCNTVDHAKEVSNRIQKVSPRSSGVFLGEQDDAQRARFLSYFEEGDLKILVSIDCLTEGVDVPACDSAIFITNSTSERESIQRRGRVLRKSEEDEVAEIHDFVTFPRPWSEIESGVDMESCEISLAHRELKRASKMAEAAKNEALVRAKVLRRRSELPELKEHVSY